MAVITSDILLEGVRRDDAFEWLGDADNHRRILEGAFDDVKQTGAGQFDLTIRTAPRPRVMTYAFQSKDDSHGGRRVLVETGGKRTRGKLHYSLRTMKPSSNTLVTIHMDYDPGAVLGALLDATTLRGALEGCLKKILENVSREIPRA